MTLFSGFSHSIASLRSDAAADGRLARKVEWVVWVRGNDGTGFELDGESADHAWALARNWARPEVGGGRVTRCEVRRVDRITGDTELFGAVEPPVPAAA